MKTINYIYETYNERGMKSFEAKVKRELKSIDLDAETVIMHNAYWERLGSGSYVRIAEIEIDGDIISLSDHTNDSWGWDAWENPTSKDKRFLFLDILQSQKNTLKCEV